MIHVRLASLSVDATTNQPVIILRPIEQTADPVRMLPIWIGHPEATAILLALQGVQPPRPMTHDLLRSIVESLDAVVARVEITRVESGTFFASVVLRAEERTVAVDARPSDSIALAIRTGSPIFVAEEVLDAAAVIEVEEEAGVNEEAEVEQFREFLDHIDPSDFQS